MSYNHKQKKGEKIDTITSESKLVDKVGWKFVETVNIQTHNSVATREQYLLFPRSELFNIYFSSGKGTGIETGFEN